MIKFKFLILYFYLIIYRSRDWLKINDDKFISDSPPFENNMFSKPEMNSLFDVILYDLF